jgi:para-nitrobenzyl esterase
MIDDAADGRPGVDRRRLLAAGGVGAAAMTPLSAALAQAGPVADTRSGKIRGYMSGKINVFKGVPYGQPTGGANRWLPPKAVAPWTTVRDCTVQGQKCPQNEGAPMVEEAVALGKEPMGEDCLNIDIWTPAIGASSGKRPVMVWYHGGGYSSGSGGGLRYDGTNLCTKQDVVLVTVTHRLNVFGFLNLASLYGPAYADSANVGMLDCVAALQWVHDNIANFGGDPGNVTIFGESGGAGKVSTMMAMPHAKGLFHRAISQSGAALRHGDPARAAQAAKTFVDALGVKSLAELQAAPQARLVEVMNSARIGAGPVVDGKWIPNHPFDPGAPAVSRDVPYLMGSNTTEVTFFADTPLDPIDDAKLKSEVKRYTRVGDADADRLIALYRKGYPGKENTYVYQVLASDWWMTDTMTVVAERKAAQDGAPAYLYYFNKHTPKSTRDGKLGAPHSIEISYAFDTLALAVPLSGPVTPAQQALADKVSGLWASFARTGKPRAKGVPAWPAYDAKARQVMVLDDTCRVMANPRAEMRTTIAEIKAKTAAATGAA